MAINTNYTTNSISGDNGMVSISSNFGFKNRIINGQMMIFQRGVAQYLIQPNTAFPTQSGGYSADRWFTVVTGTVGTGNCVVIPSSSNGYSTLQHVGNSSITNISFGQRIESLNILDLVGKQVTLSFGMSNSLLTSATISFASANSVDTFGTVATPTKSVFASNTVTIDSTHRMYSVTVTVPNAAANGVEVMLSVGAQSSGLWNIGPVQLESGPVATLYDTREIGTEIALCGRYYEQIPTGLLRISGYTQFAAASNNYMMIPFQVQKRVAPSMTISASALNLTGVAYIPSSTAVMLYVTNNVAGSWWISNSVPITLNSEIA